VEGVMAAKVGRYGLFGVVEGHVLDVDMGTLEEVDAIVETIVARVDNPANAGLDDELGALDTGRVGDI